jgi:hypothetical protein
MTLPSFTRSIEYTSVAEFKTQLNTVSQAIQAGVDTLLAQGGGVLFFPPGTYLLDAPIDLTNWAMGSPTPPPNGLALVGSGGPCDAPPTLLTRAAGDWPLIAASVSESMTKGTRTPRALRRIPRRPSSSATACSPGAAPGSRSRHIPGG